MTNKRAIYRLEALKNWFKEDSEQYIAIGKAIEALQRVESVGEKTDCVEVVRCKDCKLNDHSGYCRYDAPINPEDFCSYGERKEE